MPEKKDREPKTLADAVELGDAELEFVSGGAVRLQTLFPLMITLEAIKRYRSNADRFAELAMLPSR